MSQNSETYVKLTFFARSERAADVSVGTRANDFMLDNLALRVPSASLLRAGTLAPLVETRGELGAIVVSRAADWQARDLDRSH